MDGENNEAISDQQVHGPEEQEEQARWAEVIYADDANIVIDLDATQKITQKLLNYGSLTKTRDVKIHWGKVGIVARLKDHGELKTQLPHSFNLPITETSGKVLGNIYTWT